MSALSGPLAWVLECTAALLTPSLQWPAELLKMGDSEEAFS